MTRKKVIKDGAWLAGSQAVSQSAAFLRTVILARVLTKADMGIVALCLATVFLFDMLSDLNLGTFLIQAPDGDNPSLQRTAQSITALRGVGLSAAIFLAAKPAAYLFAVPGAVGVFRGLAVLPILRGLFHLDTSRMQRQTRYAPLIITDIVPLLVSAAVAYPLCRYFRSYSVILWLMIIQYICATALSHVLRERPYRWGFGHAALRGMLHFGWPLLVNGILMFLSFQGDRIIIGAERLFPAYAKEQLAVYSVAFSLTIAPSLALTRICSSLLLPRLARQQADLREFRRQSNLVFEGFAVASGIVLIGFMTLGGQVVVQIYGRQYADAAIIVIWLAGMQAVRLVRVGATLSALARGDTRNSMNSNLARLVGVALAICSAVTGKGIAWVAASGVMGEIVALIVSDVGLFRRHSISPLSLFRPASVVVAAGLLGCVGICAGGLTGTTAFGSAILCELLFLAVAGIGCRAFRAEVLTIFGRPSSPSRRTVLPLGTIGGRTE